MQPIQPAPPMQSSAQDMNADNDLRAQLAAVINTAHSHSHSHPHAHGYGEVPASSPSPHGHNIDPAIAGQDMMSGSAESGGDDSMNDGRKGGGKRELSQSKRAAQNRAAQRAFRQRKEGYIKKLEEQVRELHALEDNYKAIQTENYSLREYIIHLQSRLIESHGEFPQPPANINLSHPREDPNVMSQLHRHDGGVPTAPMGMGSMSQLQASAAQAVADMGPGKRQQDEAYMAQTKRFRQDNEDPVEEFKLGTGPDGLPRATAM